VAIPREPMQPAAPALGLRARMPSKAESFQPSALRRVSIRVLRVSHSDSSLDIRANSTELRLPLGDCGLGSLAIAAEHNRERLTGYACTEKGAILDEVCERRPPVL